MRLALVMTMLPALAFAQQPQYQYPPPNQYPPPPNQYPPQYQYPNQYPQQYGYPSSQGYPPQPQYQQEQYPPQPQYGYPQQAPPMQRLALTTANPESAVSAWACADALDHGRAETARVKCNDALAKDPQLMAAHILLALASPAEAAKASMDRAVETARRVTATERLWLEAVRAQQAGKIAEARRFLDQLVAAAPAEARVWYWRGKLRRAVGELDGPVADFKKSIEIDARFAQSYGELALTLAERGQLDEAVLAAQKHRELAPSEPLPSVILARLAMRKGDLADAVAQAKKALAADDKFVQARLVHGDALLFSGKAKEARKEYDALVAIDDASVHHEGAMRQARSWLYEGREVEAERALLNEADLAQKTKRPADQVESLIELGRVQLDRSGVAEAGQTLRNAQAALKDATIGDADRKRFSQEILMARAMVLAAVGERQLAEQRLDELTASLKGSTDTQKVTALRGWIAARNGDDKAALLDLAVATRPTMRMALALASVRNGDPARARSIMEELSKRLENDLEGALTRPRALAWLKQQK